jgi:GNAT superfamily N-acetyltransferase
MAATTLNLLEHVVPRVGPADAVLRAAFQNEQSFESRLRRYLAVEQEGWLVAEDRGALVGTVGAILYGAWAYIRMMAVRPNQQGRGTGRTLLKAILQWTALRGAVCGVLDASEAGAPLYARAGFADVGNSLTMTRVRLSSLPTPTPTVTTRL